MMTLEEKLMSRCIEMANMASGYTAPNPMVGCVIVENGEIIGEGYHQHFGGPHAEVNAIHTVTDKSRLKNATLYVNLEPCSHHGKTPPCSDLIIASQIPNVVVGMRDPNVVVNGNGISALRNAGINVREFILNTECAWLNRAFITWHTANRPYVLLKWAESKDGYIGMPLEKLKISCAESDVLVHKLRAACQAIMVGSGTWINDKPQLNNRHWKGKSPLKFIADRRGRLINEPDFINDDSLYIITDAVLPDNMNQRIIQNNSADNSFESILNTLYHFPVLSVLIEGGKLLHESALASSLWDEVIIIKSNFNIGKGIVAPQLHALPYKTQMVGADTWYYFKNNHR